MKPIQRKQPHLHAQKSAVELVIDFVEKRTAASWQCQWPLVIWFPIHLLAKLLLLICSTFPLTETEQKYKWAQQLEEQECFTYEQTNSCLSKSDAEVEVFINKVMNYSLSCISILLLLKLFLSPLLISHLSWLLLFQIRKFLAKPTLSNWSAISSLRWLYVSSL